MQIIAEMGCNWKTREEAFKMMGMAKALGIDLVKYQLFNKDMTPKQLHPFIIDEEFAQSLVRCGREHDQEVFFSCMYPETIDMCEKIGVRYYKVRYFDRNNLPILRKLKKVKDKIIFVSCKTPRDTIFGSMAKYHGNVRFLYCIPKYPAEFGDYPLITPNGFSGFSDHTPDLQLLKHYLEYPFPDYFEIHLKIDDDCIEAPWSKSFLELKEVLQG